MPHHSCLKKKPAPKDPNPHTAKILPVESVSERRKPMTEADAIIETIERKKIARLTTGIQEQLDSINGRIKHTLDSYDLVEKLSEETPAGDLAFVKDMEELLSIATDAIKKKKYMKEVSVFIVGFSNACEERLKILTTLNEFLMAQAAAPEIDHAITELDDKEEQARERMMADAFEYTSLGISKLSSLNSEIVAAVEAAVTLRERQRGNLKIKKQLDKAKEEIQQLSEKVTRANAEIEAKEAEITRLTKQVEDQNKQLDRIKVEFADAKLKAALVDGLKEKVADMEEEMKLKDHRMDQIMEEIAAVEESKQKMAEELHSVIAIKQETIEVLEQQIETMESEHANKVEEMTMQHQLELETLRRQMEFEMADIKATLAGEIDTLRQELEEQRAQFSEMEAKAASLSEELAAIKNKPLLTEEDIGPPFELADEEAWASVSDEETKARFSQYRKLAMSRISQLEEEASKNADMERKIKAQFLDMEQKWNTERQLLLDQAEQAEQHRQQAEQEAETAVFQLETFLDDVETLHKMHDYLSLESKHYCSLDNATQAQFLKTITASAREALLRQVQEAPYREANAEVQTEEIMNGARKSIDELNDSSRRSMRSAEARMRNDPMLCEYLRAYDFVQDFKDSVALLFADKSIASLEAILKEIYPLEFNRDNNAFQQISEMQHQFIIALAEVLGIFVRILYREEYDYKKLPFFVRHLPDMVPRAMCVEIDESVCGGGNAQTLRKQMEEMKNEYEIKLKDLQEKFEESDSQNDHLKLKMEELFSKLEDSEKKLAEFEAQKSAILFTRLDAERNIRNLKKAVQYDKIDMETFEKATDLIEKYTSLPEKKLVNLVKKYASVCSMKLLQENLRRATAQDGAEIQLITNFEKLQGKRLAQWDVVMAELSEQRQTLARQLTATMEGIEDESGIFLIKPIYSYRAKIREFQQRRPISSRQSIMSNYLRRTPPKPINPRVKDAPFVPGPTPKILSSTLSAEMPSGFIADEMVGAGYAPLERPVPMWNKSQALPPPVADSREGWGGGGVPKMMELDVNRFMLEHNNVTALSGTTLKLGKPPGAMIGDDFTLMAPRSYLTLSRTIPPTVPLPKDPADTTDQPPLPDTSQPPNRLPPLGSQ